jgi:hypothetical protein
MIAAISIVGGIWGDFGRDQQGEINCAAQDSNDGTTIGALVAANLSAAYWPQSARCDETAAVFKDMILENHTVTKGESAFPLPSGRRQSGRLPPDNHSAEA